jgi:ABC-type uncharacterized transport system substrate-binding protein
MKRREFITLLGGAAAWPLAARAQQAGKLPIIGFLGPVTGAVSTESIPAFERRLGELGWVNRRTVAIEYRWGEGRPERYAEIAAEFVRLGVDVIATWGTETAVAAKHATSAIPIVFTVVGDPVGSGLVASLARPGGNVTGLSTQHRDAAGKRLELLREVLPSLGRLAIMANFGNSGALLELREAATAAGVLGIETVEIDIRRAEDLIPAFASVKGRADGLYVASDPLLAAHRATLNGLALDARLPSVDGFGAISQTAGLLSYAPNLPDLLRRSADYVDKVLRGSRPGDIPVEQPTRFELRINLKTARARRRGDRIECNLLLCICRLLAHRDGMGVSAPKSARGGRPEEICSA